MTVQAPFSRKFAGSQPWVQDDFPQTARNALLHLLYDLVEKDYVDGWVDIDKEMRRISHSLPIVYNRGIVATSEDARVSAEEILKNLEWPKIFDFCERLSSHLATPVRSWNDFAHDWNILVEREDVKRYITDELQRIFLEEHLGYSFSDDGVYRRSRSHTRKQVSNVEPTLGDSRLATARTHYSKALKYFDHPSKPDYENSVKEAVCAVEASARHLFPDAKGNSLGQVIKRISGEGEGQLPKPIADTLTGLYGYRNTGNGVSHGGANGGKVTKAIAEYALALAASQIILLHDLSSSMDSKVPF